MNADTFSFAMGQLDDRYVLEAIRYDGRNSSNPQIRWSKIKRKLCDRPVVPKKSEYQRKRGADK